MLEYAAIVSGVCFRLDIGWMYKRQLIGVVAKDTPIIVTSRCGVLFCGDFSTNMIPASRQSLRGAVCYGSHSLLELLAFVQGQEHKHFCNCTYMRMMVFGKNHSNNSCWKGWFYLPPSIQHSFPVSVVREPWQVLTIRTGYMQTCNEIY